MFSIKNPRPWRNGRILRKGKCKTCSGLWNILLQGTYTTLDEINRLKLKEAISDTTSLLQNQNFFFFKGVNKRISNIFFNK